MVEPGSWRDIEEGPFFRPPSFLVGAGGGRCGAVRCAVFGAWCVACGGRGPAGAQRRGSRSLPIRSRSRRSSVRISRVTRPMIRCTSSSSWKSVNSLGSKPPGGISAYSGGALADEGAGVPGGGGVVVPEARGGGGGGGVRVCAVAVWVGGGAAGGRCGAGLSSLGARWTTGSGAGCCAGRDVGVGVCGTGGGVGEVRRATGSGARGVVGAGVAGAAAVRCTATGVDARGRAGAAGVTRGATSAGTVDSGAPRGERRRAGAAASGAALR